MELQTKNLGEGLSDEGKILIEMTARSIRDYISEFAGELEDETWEEHGVDGELADQLTLIGQSVEESTTTEVETALAKHGLEVGPEGSTLTSFALGLFEELCEGSDSEEEFNQDQFQELFSPAKSLSEAEEELKKIFEQKLEEDEHALEDPAWVAVATLRFSQEIREEIDVFEIQESMG